MLLCSKLTYCAYINAQCVHTMFDSAQCLCLSSATSLTIGNTCNKGLATHIVTGIQSLLQSCVKLLKLCAPVVMDISVVK